MPSSVPLRSRLADTRRSRLALRARELASGWAAGSHRADRKGSGVEFAGHRAYTPGDDLRHLDRHALLRHKQLLIREFFTDTERGLHLVVDVTSSMHYRGRDESKASAERETKAERALLLAAALAHVGREAGDHLGLSWISDGARKTQKPKGGAEAFEHIMHELVSLDQDLSTRAPTEKKSEQEGGGANFEDLFRELGSAIPRGTIVVVLSDLLDLDRAQIRSLSALCTRKRTVRAAQILTPEEVEFPFDGALRFLDLESGREVETDGGQVKTDYIERLEAYTADIRKQLLAQGGQLIRARTDEDPKDTLRHLASGAASER